MMIKMFSSKTLWNNIFNLKFWGIKSDDVSYHYPLAMEDHLLVIANNQLFKSWIHHFETLR